MTALNLPSAPLRIKTEGNRSVVFDILRRRWVKLTPEEWVRQHFVHYLIHAKGYPQGRLGNEVSLKVGETSKRCDTLVYDDHALPYIIIEYKAPTVPITQKVFDQISRYNMPLRVPYMIVSNGMQHYCCHIDYEKGAYEFLKEIPQAQTPPRPPKGGSSHD